MNALRLRLQTSLVLAIIYGISSTLLATTWTAQSSGTTAVLRSPWGSDASHIWTVGVGGVVQFWNGSTWSSQSSGTTQNLFAVTGVDSSHVWATGNSGTVVFWNGTAWSALSSGSTQALNAAWAYDTNHVWVVGSNGAILFWDGTSFTTQTSNTTNALNGVWGSGPSDVWAVGGTGTASTIVHWNGSTWSSISNSFGQLLRGVWGVDSSHVWAAGGASGAGTILFWNGSTWSQQTAAVTASLFSVWAADANNAWVVGQPSGTTLGIQKWNGATWTLDNPPTGSGITRGISGIKSLGLVFNVGDTGSIYTGAFSLPAPIVTGISPTNGSTAGGTNVTITGTGFTGATGATVGGLALTSFSVADDTTIHGITGAHPAGVADVAITGSPNGASTGGSGAFTYVAAAPTVTTPTSASITGTGATLGGNVTSDGGATITERGVVYSLTSTNGNPQIGGTGVTKVTASGTTGIFTANVSGLTAGTGYSFAAYATSSVGTTYTTPVSTFTTLSNNADLSNLVVNTATYSPVFSSSVIGYTSEVPRSVASVTVTPTAAQANAVINVRVNGGTYAPVTSASASGSLVLNLGNNTIDVQVTAQDGVTQKTYSVTVKRLTYLEAWRRLHFNSLTSTGNAADNFTPQNDGLPNLLKFATAMNPEVNGVSPTGIVKNGSTLEFTYPRSLEAKVECTFIVEWSETLLAGSWSAVGVSEQVLSTTSTLEQVKASLPAGTLGRRFVRLRVTNP